MTGRPQGIHDPAMAAWAQCLKTGFAVVADKVRQLAARTSEATEAIVGLVDRNQTSVQNAVERMEVSQENAGNGVALAREAGQLIEENQADATRVVQTMSSRTDALESQLAASNRS